MEFRILGPLEVEDEGRLLKLGGAKQRAVLALLLLHANDGVPRERLIDELWGGEPPDTARTALQVHVSQLRKLLGSDRIETRSPGYALRLESGELDLERFEALVAQARGLEPAAASAALRQALGMWQGSPLGELEGQAFARRERLRLEELRLAAVEERIEADFKLGRHAELVQELERLVADHPLRERLRGQLMLALYRSGRQAEALEAYRQGQRLLADELGLEPGEELRRLEKAILAQDPELIAVAKAEARAREVPTGTVTFLFTDIEGSTQLLKQLAGDYGEMLAEHQRILRAAFEAHGGWEVDTQGDSFFVAFRRAKDAVAAAVAAQRDLAAHPWPHGGGVRVRMGLHTGEPQVGGERYVGLGVHKAARIGAAGHGGQVLLSRTTRELVEDELPTGVTIRDLGERRLKDVDRPERLSQLVIDGLPSQFGALNTLDVELRRKRRRMYAGAALIGVLAAAVAIPVFALGQGSGGGTVVAPNSVAIIDPESNRVTGSIPVGIRPSSVAVGEGSVWVANFDDRTVSRIDPGTRAVQLNIPLQATPTGVATGAGAVWLANGLLGSFSRLDPGVNAVVVTLPVTSRSSAGSAAFGEGAVWFAFGVGEVVKVDPSTNVPLGNSGVVGNSPSALAVGAGSVWVANAGSNTLSQVNPRTVSEVRPFTVGGRPRSVAFGAGAVWVANEADDNVTRIDAPSGSASNIPVGVGPTGVAYGAGAVWVANAGDGTVSKIDPVTGDVVKTIRVGNRPTGIAFGEGAVWVTVQAPTEE
jgi:YVTN family beta-propeller protein